MKLRAQQERIVEILQETAILSDIKILAEDRKDLVTTINTALAKLGLCVVVQMISARVTKPNKPGPVYDDVKFSAVVYENVMINRSKSDRTAHSVAENIAETLHQKRMNPDGGGKEIHVEAVLPQTDSDFFVVAVDMSID